ncbi:MAG TPA: DUF5372 family protein [Mycobacterium sp.]|nr:DUF5372 family protein [Mycobacterium sp.]
MFRRGPGRRAGRRSPPRRRSCSARTAPSARPVVCSTSATALDPVGDQRTVRVTHPFHPWSGREFVFLAVRQTWSQDRVFFLDGDGRQFSLPVGWTDAADPDAFVTIAAGRCPFRFVDLVELRRLIDGRSD